MKGSLLGFVLGLSLAAGFAKDPPSFEERVTTCEKEIKGLKAGMKILADENKKLRKDVDSLNSHRHWEKHK